MSEDTMGQIRNILADEIASDTGKSLDDLFHGLAETLIVFYCNTARVPHREEFVNVVASIYDEVLMKHEARNRSAFQ